MLSSPALLSRVIRPAARLSASHARWSSSSQPRPPTPPFRVLLLGSDAFSCATLSALQAYPTELLEHIAVLTPPSARSGRGLKTVAEPALQRLAKSLGVAHHQLSDTGFRGWAPPHPFDHRSPSNILLAASFGHMIPSTILDLFEPQNALNIHPSVLPKYRGAAPIQWALINGDRETGVSVQELSKGKFDRGRLLGQRAVSIPEDADFKSLEPVLAREGADLLLDILRNLHAAQESATPQDPAGASSAPKLTREHARIAWSSSAPNLIQLQRGIAHQYPLWSTFSTPSTPASTSIQLELAPSVMPPSSAAIHLTASKTGSLMLDPSTKPATLLARCGGASGDILGVARVKVAGGKWVAGSEWASVRNSRVVVLE